MEIKIYLKSLLAFFIPLIIMLLLVNLFYYYDIISNNLIKYLKIIIILISSFIAGYIRGYNSQNKGYINGLKLSLLVIILFFIMSIIFKSVNFTNIIYYLIISLTITFGSMVGINYKK